MPEIPFEQVNNPIVSVVMVVRNMESFLEESIESVLSQTFRGFEFIILDYGSTDDSRAIVSSYAARDSRISLHEIPTCSLAEVRNSGCSLAQGRYIAIQDADDVSLPDRLRLEVDFLEKNPEIGLLGGLTEWVGVNGKTMWVPYLPTDENEIKSALVSDFPFCHSSLLIRKEAFDLVGGYRPLITQSHDYDLSLRISEHFRCANLKEVIVKYRVHPNQISSIKRRQQTLCKLAAQTSALARRTGCPDPLNGVEEITPAVLIGLGVTETRQQSELFSGYRSWIMNLSAAGESQSALKATVEALQSDWEFIEQRQVAGLHYTAAQLYFKQKKYLKAFLATCHAVMMQPSIVGRVGQGLLWRLGRRRKDRNGLAPRTVQAPRSDQRPIEK